MPKNIEELEDQTDFDTSAAIAEISADLFGQGGEGEDTGAGSAEAGAGEVPSGPTDVEPNPSQQPGEGEAPPAGEAPKPEDNAPQVQEVGAPKTWSKEALQEWATLPARAQQEILKREEDFLKGITMYKEKAELGSRYDSVVDPFRPILQAENIDPVQLFQSFASNHYLLSRGTPEQKVELAAQLISGYGVDFQQLVHRIGDRMLAPVDPRVAQLEAEVRELRQGHQSRQQQEQQALEQRLAQEVESFANDPANIYFNDLVADIQQIFAAGQASTLKEAYDKAVYLNPVTRQKEIERLAAEKLTSCQAEEQERQTKIAKSTAADLSLDSKPKNGTVPIGSLDDTLAETMAAILGRS